jgi:uncharacterized BrkB/YihY/UPF0761 family membrane protein
MKLMEPRWRGDPAAIAAAVIACGVAVVYVWLMRQEKDQPVGWFLGGLVLSVLLCGYGSARVPLRRSALAAAGGIMVMIGTLGILSIGLPVLVAGIVALLAAARPRATNRPTPADR